MQVAILNFGERGEQTTLKSNGSKVYLGHKLLFPGKVLEKGLEGKGAGVRLSRTTPFFLHAAGAVAVVS